MAGLAAFERLFAQEEAAIDLARACLLVAEDAYPGLDVDGYLGEIERLAARLRRRLGANLAPEERIVALNEFLFDQLGFCGNTEDYYDPRNSYLNEVLERRTGIPITLSVLYMELGQRIGLPLAGVSFPGHFLVRMRLRGGTLVLDPFSGGAPQSADELRQRLARAIPPGASGPLPLEAFLEPAGKRQILARLLRNLKAIYLAQRRPERLLQVLDRMRIVVPEAAVELRDRGLVYEQLECWGAALRDFRDYLERAPDAADAQEIRARALELARRLARMH